MQRLELALVFGQQLSANVSVAWRAQPLCIQQTKSRLKGSCVVRAPTLELATSKSNSKPNGCWATRRRHGGQATVIREASQLRSRPTWALDVGRVTSKGSKPTAVIASMGVRLWQAPGPYFLTARREQANSSHGQYGHKTLASYKT